MVKSVGDACGTVVVEGRVNGNVTEGSVVTADEEIEEEEEEEEGEEGSEGSVKREAQRRNTASLTWLCSISFGE